MRRRTFHGHGKLFLELRNGELVVKNVPVPRGAFYAPWVARNLRILDRLRTVQILRSVLPGAARRERPDAAESRAVLLNLIEELFELNRSKDSLLIVVFVPTRADCASDCVFRSCPRDPKNPAPRIGVVVYH